MQDTTDCLLLLDLTQFSLYLWLHICPNLCFWFSLKTLVSASVRLPCDLSPYADIERTYGERKYLGRFEGFEEFSKDGRSPNLDINASNMPITYLTDYQSPTSYTPLHDLKNRYFYNEPILFYNLDLFRARDLIMITCFVYVIILSVLPTKPLHFLQNFHLMHTLFWRLFHSGGLGLVLHSQSRTRWFVRHFVKNYLYGKQLKTAAVKEAFANWTAIYNFSLIMTFLSFALMAWNNMVAVNYEHIGPDLLRFTAGLILISLHIWTAIQTYSVLGHFGWFVSC